MLWFIACVPNIPCPPSCHDIGTLTPLLTKPDPDACSLLVWTRLSCWLGFFCAPTSPQFWPLVGGWNHGKAKVHNGFTCWSVCTLSRVPRIPSGGMNNHQGTPEGHTLQADTLQRKLSQSALSLSLSLSLARSLSPVYSIVSPAMALCSPVCPSSLYCISLLFGLSLQFPGVAI